MGKRAPSYKKNILMLAHRSKMLGDTFSLFLNRYLISEENSDMETRTLDKLEKRLLSLADDINARLRMK